MTKIKHVWAKVFHYISLTILSFLTGAVLVFFNLPPRQQIEGFVDHFFATAQGIVTNVALNPYQHMLPMLFEKSGFDLIAAEKMQPGLTFLISIFDDQMTARLYTPAGRLVHQWPIDFFSLPFDTKTHRYHALWHGVHLYPDGSMLAVLEGQTLFKFSRCGEIIWRSDHRSHHSVHVDEDGVIWTPVVSNTEIRPTISSQPTMFDAIAAFDPDTGELIRKIDLANVLIESNLEALATANRPNFIDVLHTNDVEILSSDLAKDFDEFEAGDIMVNARNLNQIWILDGKDHSLKWWMTGPMSGAHDPDFQPGGRITILDNRNVLDGPITSDRVGNMGGSRILEITVSDRSTRTLFKGGGDTTFYTGYRGKHQILDNGNILIAETDGGRAFEVTSEGELVWQFVNALNENWVLWLMDAIRVPESYASAFDTPCPDT